MIPGTILPQPYGQDHRSQLLKHALNLIQLLLTITANILSGMVRKPPTPYHTSILSGYHWVSELLSGHPDHIRCELGVRKETFIQLVTELRKMGFKDSKFVTLEEQLAIFLYTCVTGLTTQHVGECFQCSNDTISQYVV